MDAATIANIRAGITHPKPQPIDNCGADNPQAKCGQETTIGYTNRKMSQERNAPERLIEEIAYAGQAASNQADKAQKALDFFEAHPAFVEFIALVKTGVISIY